MWTIACPSATGTPAACTSTRSLGAGHRPSGSDAAFDDGNTSIGFLNRRNPPCSRRLAFQVATAACREPLQPPVVLGPDQMQEVWGSAGRRSVVWRLCLQGVLLFIGVSRVVRDLTARRGHADPAPALPAAGPPPGRHRHLTVRMSCSGPPVDGRPASRSMALAVDARTMTVTLAGDQTQGWGCASIQRRVPEGASRVVRLSAPALGPADSASRLLRAVLGHVGAAVWRPWTIPGGLHAHRDRPGSGARRHALTTWANTLPSGARTHRDPVGTGLGDGQHRAVPVSAGNPIYLADAIVAISGPRC